MFRNALGRYVKPLVTVGPFALIGAVLLVGSDAASSTVAAPQDEVTIEPLGHFGGLLFSVAVSPTGGDYVYLGESSGLTALDTSNPSQPRQVAGLPLEGSDVNDVAILDETAYVLKSGALKVVDLSKPIDPTLAGETDLPGTGRAVAAAGSYAYVAADVGGTDGWVYTVDVSDATDPDPIGSYDTAGLPRDTGAASDTAYDHSDHPFSVPRKDPTVFIMDPEEGQTYAIDEWVLLTALAYDQDDDDLAEDDMAWTSDLDGPLGTGSEVALESLSRGWHTITLTGTDGEGLTSSHSVRVCVGCTDIYLPLILRE